MLLRSYDCFFYFAFDHIFKGGIEVAPIEIMIGFARCPRGKVKHTPYTAYTIDAEEDFIGIDIAKGKRPHPIHSTASLGEWGGFVSI